jgi:hypothetical protein
MAVAFKGASWTDPDSIPLMVLQTMLGESLRPPSLHAPSSTVGFHDRFWSVSFYEQKHIKPQAVRRPGLAVTAHILAYSILP